MPPSAQDADGQSPEPLENGSQQPVQLRQFALSLSSLTSHLDTSFNAGKSFEDATLTWHSWQADLLVKKYADVLHARLAWWNYLRNPIWACIFFIERKRYFEEPRGLNFEELARLDYLLGRAEFSYSLSGQSRNLLRKKVKEGKISGWQALSLTRSIGCKISKEGDLVASPIGSIGLNIGKFMVLVLASIFILFGTGLVTELNGSCVRPCVVVGSFQLMAFSLYFSAFAHSLTVRRNHFARSLAQLQIQPDL